MKVVVDYKVPTTLKSFKNKFIIFKLHENHGGGNSQVYKQYTKNSILFQLLKLM
jgi:hypothetical protein